MMLKQLLLSFLKQLLLSLIWIFGAFLALNSKSVWVVMLGILLVSLVSNFEGYQRAKDERWMIQD